MIAKVNVDIVDIQTFKTNNSVRPHVDLGEITGEDMKQLWDLKRKPFQECGVIIGTNEEIETIYKMIELMAQNELDIANIKTYLDAQ